MNRNTVLSVFSGLALSILSALILCFVFTGSAERSGKCGNDLMWSLDNEGELTISGSGAMYNYGLKLADRIYATSAPWGSNVSSVSIQQGVASIGAYAFAYCKNLTYVTLPESVTAIGGNAFSHCNNLTNIAISNGLTRIGALAFSDCISLTGIQLPDSISSIGDVAFENCSSLTSINIPANLSNIGAKAFYGCESLTNFTVDRDNSFYTLFDGVLYDNDLSVLIYCPAGKDNPTIPKSVTCIGNSAFCYCKGLRNITIPSSVTSIGSEAFSYCSNLLSLSIPNGVNRIEGATFSHCSSLLSVSIPDSVTGIGMDAFSYCSRLKSITIPDSVTSIADFAFEGCGNLERITIPNGVTYIGISTFGYCTRLMSVVLHDNISAIEENAFQECSDGIKLYANVGSQTAYQLSVKGYTFREPGGYLDLKYEDGTNLAVVRADKNRTSIVIPEGVSLIKSNAFCDCNKLESIIVPKSVNLIGDGVFYACNNLERVYILGYNTSFGIDVLSTSPVIYCYEYSDAEGWAIDNCCEIVMLDNYDPESERVLMLPDTVHIEVGKTWRMAIDVIPNYDQPCIAWSSSDDNIVSVVDGVLSARAIGTVTITATVGSAQASTRVTTYISARDFDLSETEVWLVAKETLFLSVVNLQPKGAQLQLEWVTSDTAYATVNGNGLVVTKKPGDVTIAAVNENGMSEQCLIHICYPVTKIAFVQDGLTVHAGKTLQLTANVTMSTQNCVNQLVTFTSSDESTATVDANGVITAHMPGTVTITATAASGVSAACTVTVEEARILNLPASITEIDSRALANLLNADIIVIPTGITRIALDAFVGSDVMLSVAAGSYAESWAIENGVKHIVR